MSTSSLLEAVGGPWSSYNQAPSEARAFFSARVEPALSNYGLGNPSEMPETGVECDTIVSMLGS
jgi:hypothetical protein